MEGYGRRCGQLVPTVVNGILYVASYDRLSHSYSLLTD